VVAVEVTFAHNMSPAPHQHCILVIEDDYAMRDSLTQALAGEGFQVLASSDGVDALAKLATVQPCLMLLDLMMPGMDGWQFMEELRIHPGFSRIPVVVVSAYGTREGVCSVGAADYLRKPFEFKALLDLVGRYCRLGCELEPGVR